MRSHGIALCRWTCLHRHELLVAAAFAVTAATLLFVGPLLLALAALEWKMSTRRKSRLLGLVFAAVLTRALLWLWRDLRGVPHRRWHACAQCRGPIEAPSRAWYCSPGCRRYARLERDAGAFDPVIAGRARARLRRLREQADRDPALAEIPF
jgi:hypothetical protein